MFNPREFDVKEHQDNTGNRLNRFYPVEPVSDASRDYHTSTSNQITVTILNPKAKNGVAYTTSAPRFVDVKNNSP